jgi:hypothetical protein
MLPAQKDAPATGGHRREGEDPEGINLMSNVARTREPSEWLRPEHVRTIVPDADVETLRDLRRRRQGPPFYRPDIRTVLYLRADLEAWKAGE